MKIQYISDLHLERKNNQLFFNNNKIKPIGDILILAGDITAILDEFYEDSFFDYVSENWDFVYMIPGNHEYYAIDDDMLLNKPFINRNIRHNVLLLNNQSIIIEDTKIIFSTMWTHISIDKGFNIQQHIKDFRYIKYNGVGLLYTDLNEIFKKSFEYIKSEVENNKSKNLIIVTHHAPTSLVISQQYKSDIYQEAFSVELHPFIFDNDIDYWIYGHTHQSIDKEINGTKIISNQFGYAESGGILKNRIIDI